jgi:uncharacterized protein
MKLSVAGSRAVFLAAYLLFGPVGCGDRGEVEDTSALLPAVTWDTAEVRIETAEDTIPIRVEVAANDEQRAVGLMHRTSLPEDSGMLFVYDSLQPPEGSFWMFNTRIPLDIAFLDADGVIVSIRQMEPCASPYPQWCPSYEAGAAFQYALEMNLGWFQRKGAGIGDRVVLPL